MRTSVLSLQRALPAPGIRPRLVPVPVCFGLCPFLTDRGHTSPWTSSPACPRPVETPPVPVIDRFSKAAHFVALPKLPSSSETADLLVRHVFRLHGIPADIVSDRGPQFTSQVWRAFCAALGATPSLSSGFHPQSNGQSERANQEMEAALRCVSHANPSSWTSQLPWVEYAHNTLVNASTVLSPFMASLGYQPPLFPELEEEISVPSVQAHMRRCRRTWKRTRTALLRASSRSQL